MYLIILAWLYITLLMALVEAFSTQGTVMGAIITFLLYGLVPMSLVAYLMGTPLRRKARHQAEEASASQHAMPDSVGQPNTGGHAPGLSEAPAVAAVRKES